MQPEKSLANLDPQFEERKLRTEAVPKHRPRIGEVVIHLVVHEAKGEDQEVEENPDEEKQATATLVDHPDTPFVEDFLGLVWPLLGGANCVRPLERLQTPPLGLVSLEVARLGDAVGICFLEVRVLVQLGDLAAVGKVEARGPFHPAEVGCHGELANGQGTTQFAVRAS